MSITEKPWLKLSTRVCNILQEKHMTQKQLAYKMGIDETTLSRYLNGMLEISLTRLDSMARALNVSLTYLLSDYDYEGMSEKEFNKIKKEIDKNSEKMSPRQKADLVKSIYP